MCGLLASCGPVPAVAFHAARAAAAARGPHSYGWSHASTATTRPGDAIAATGYTTTRGLGPLPRPGAADRPGPDRIVVGHSRLATSTAAPGALPDPAEGGPVSAGEGRWLLAHNGSTPHPSFAALPAPCDSRGLLAILARVARDGGGLGYLTSPEGRALLSGRPQALILAAPDGTVSALRVDGETRPAHPLYLTTYRAAGAGGAWLLSSAPVAPASALLPAGIPLILEPPV